MIKEVAYTVHELGENQPATVVFCKGLCRVVFESPDCQLMVLSYEDMLDIATHIIKERNEK